MEPVNSTADGHLLPALVAVLEAVEVLREQLLNSPLLPATVPARANDQHPSPRPSSLVQAVQLEATFFGGFALIRELQPVAFGQQRCSLEICRYLIAQRGRLVPRDELLEILWPAARDSPGGLHRLHVAVSAVRRHVDPRGDSGGFIQLTGECYSVPADAVETDFARFDCQYCEAKQSLARGDDAAAAAAFRAAIALYRGDFLADHPYAEWTQLLRDHYRERRLTALTILCDCAAHTGDLHAVVELATDILAVDNLRETAHRHLMRARYHSGERGLALRQYVTCARLLDGELGVAPSPLTRRLYEAILADQPLPTEPSSMP